MAFPTQFAEDEKRVYRAAVKLAREEPGVFDAQQLAGRLGCEESEARTWMRWLRKTGDFVAAASGRLERTEKGARS
jgi:hypothetical protein